MWLFTTKHQLKNLQINGVKNIYYYETILMIPGHIGWQYDVKFNSNDNSEVIVVSLLYNISTGIIVDDDFYCYKQMFEWYG